MYVFITVLILIAAVCLILIVLVQNSKGGGRFPRKSHLDTRRYRYRVEYRCSGFPS